ncbi:TRAP transporter substrate-binding protein DctP [Pusillimonas sp.]|uniref:TRAP transporter substrate-binding protein DctP n=1 Tax=Pusillimonas sp. TaxID=3040095 RepID=UPI0037C8D7E3
MRLFSNWRTTAVAALAAAATFSAIPAGVAAAATTLRISHTTAESMQQGSHVWAVVFKEMVEDRTGGEVKVQILGANAAGGEREQLQKAQTGINQMTINSEILMPSFFKPAQILGIPYLFRSDAVAWQVLDGDFGKEFNDAWRQATGLRILGVMNAGFRSFFNGSKQVQVPGDLKGLKIRTGENQAHIAMVRALGGNPVPIAWSELYTSLQQGVVDGMENPPGLAFAMKLHEHQKHLTLDRHLFSIHAAMINERTFQSLTPEQQAIVYEAAQTATTAARATVLLSERQALKDLEKAGLEIYAPTAEQYEEFRSLGRPPVEEMVRKDVGDEWVDKLLQGIDAAEASVGKP